jgi:hypothetical protein
MGGMETRLKGNLGNAWQIVAVHVAYCEHLRVSGQRTVWFHFDATSPIPTIARSKRPFPTKDRNQLIRAVNRFLKPVMNVMCTTSQT